MILSKKIPKCYQKTAKNYEGSSETYLRFSEYFSGETSSLSSKAKNHRFGVLLLSPNLWKNFEGISARNQTIKT